ncbi:hypothetical protein QYM36_006348, partial [Artemia franciscana]
VLPKTKVSESRLPERFRADIRYKNSYGNDTIRTVIMLCASFQKQNAGPQISELEPYQENT